MAIDIFLKIDGIEGESVDSRHPKEIEVESYTWGVQQVPNLGVGAESPLGVPRKGGGGAKASFQDLTFTHRLDKASPKLIEACATGAVIPQALLVLRKAGAKPLEFSKVTLTDVTVSSVSFSAGSSDAVPMEEVALRYGSVTIQYFPQKADGSADAPITTTCQTK
ncbi:MAG TPA: type VI secretion system tube protein Hcp [Symbiobacteriaceae bacterium]|nr:type VI secretion system tube protein Hcp [Symbiobacteriaceae bacterium]